MIRGRLESQGRTLQCFIAEIKPKFWSVNLIEHIGHVTRKKRTKMALCYSTLAPLTGVGQCRHWMRMIIEERHWKTWCSWDWRDVGNYTISVWSVRQWHHYRVSAAICGHQPLDHEKLLVMPRSRLIKSSASHGVNSVTFYSVLDIYY